MSKTTNEISLEVRERVVRLVLDNEHEHASRCGDVAFMQGREIMAWYLAGDDHS